MGEAELNGSGLFYRTVAFRGHLKICNLADPLLEKLPTVLRLSSIAVPLTSRATLE